MTPEQEKLLADSITALEDGDYSSPCSGYRLYLDPEEYSVYVFSCVGTGVPEAAWHGRHAYICDIPTDAIPSSVRGAVFQIKDRLIALCEAYLGSEWNGSNHVGRWDEEREGISDHGEMLEILCYWDPQEWFSGDDTDYRVRERLAAGETPDDILADLWLGDDSTGEVRDKDACEWVESLVAEVAS